MSWAGNARKFLIAAVAFALIVTSIAIASWAGTESATEPVPFVPVFDVGGNDKVIEWSLTFQDGTTESGVADKNDILVRGVEYHISCSEIPPGPGLLSFFILHHKNNGTTKSCGDPYLTAFRPTI